MSLARYFNKVRRIGLKEYFRQMMYIGDVKVGRCVGSDQFGNRYFENMNPEEEVPGRHRWVDFAQHDFNATQVPAEWHAWISHIRKDPPPEDRVMQNLSPSWKAPWIENLTGTRGAYRPYNTTLPKYDTWEPKVASREGPSA
ncbi:NDUFA12-domain-containing protein [Obba rivulosa]|uniref:NADH dehydrogenase [ubiquinone] 1 alpha subcomplex subunit n=1 Tax=Obba rivulosa TaxID=1052685 RepID=A0A8E2ARB2_9APHY|nr:NDUFA12-domain-containing protein [Obba rivulosa]